MIKYSFVVSETIGTHTNRITIVCKTKSRALFEISEKLFSDYGYVASPKYISKNLLIEINSFEWEVEKFSIKINKVRRVDE